MLPCCHAAMLPCCHAAMLPCCHAAMLPCCHAGYQRCRSHTRTMYAIITYSPEIHSYIYTHICVPPSVAIACISACLNICTSAFTYDKMYNTPRILGDRLDA
jgi:hypothetical protein